MAATAWGFRSRLRRCRRSDEDNARRTGRLRRSGGPQPRAIEITGYLDSARVAWTFDGERAWAAGLEGAASAGSEVVLAREGESASGEVGDAGTFALSIAASAGDRVTLKVVGADDSEAQSRDLVVLPPLPPYLRVSAIADIHQESAVLIEIELQPAREDGQFWALNTARAEAVTVLEAHLGGSLHAGTLGGIEGDVLLLWFVPDAGLESEPLDLTVEPAP